MGVFSDYVGKYYDAGLVCIPIGDKKAPIQSGWQIYCDERPTLDLIEKWETQFANVDKFGLCLGSVSGIVAFDFDYSFDIKRAKCSEAAFEKDLKIVEAHILRALPQTPAIKIGKKGWTRFFKWTPELGSESNIACDRNGVRLFDFLSWHKQTIMPPSIHTKAPDGQSNHLLYRWVGQAILDCLDDIPEIGLAVVQEMKLIFGEAGGFVDNSRHGRLFSWIMRMSEVERDASKLAMMLVAKDALVNGSDPKGPYLIDRQHFRSANAIENAAHWLTRVLRWKEARRDLGEPRPAVDQEGWNHFFDGQFPFVRKDILSKKVFIKRDEPSQWVDVMNLEGVLKCNAYDLGLPRTHVKDRLEKFVFEKAKEDFLCDIPKWDGVDRIDLIGRCIVSPEFSFEEMVSILKHWGAGIFARINDSDEQNRCLILKGGQGLGKDSLVKSMLKDFKPYFETTNLSGTPKDVYEIISRIFVLHIEEFEQTAKLDVAFIKSIITQSSAFFRESYGRSPDRKNVAVSMISTTNRDDVLRDPTGNRRFIVVPVERILWEYPRKESLQVVAQFKHLFDAGGFELSDKIEGKIKDILERFTPPDPNDVIFEMYRTRFDLLLRNLFPGKKVLTGGEIQSCLKDIARENEVSIRRVQSILKAKKFSRRTELGTIYYRNPSEWLE